MSSASGPQASQAAREKALDGCMKLPPSSHPNIDCRSIVGTEVDDHTPPDHDTGARIHLEQRREMQQRIRGVPVVRIQPGQDPARGARHPLVDGVALSTVFLADPIGQVLFVLSNDLDRLVGASTINDDVFEIRIALRQNRIDRACDVIALVVTRRHDRYARSISKVTSEHR